MEITHRMTTMHFDAPASSTPRRIAASPYPIGTIAGRIVRVAWLTALLVRRERVQFERYRQRFGASLRTFHRDIACLRDAGLYLEVEYPYTYWLLCFMADSDAA